MTSHSRMTRSQSGRRCTPRRRRNGELVGRQRLQTSFRSSMSMGTDKSRNLRWQKSMPAWVQERERCVSRSHSSALCVLNTCRVHARRGSESYANSTSFGCSAARSRLNGACCVLASASPCLATVLHVCLVAHQGPNGRDSPAGRSDICEHGHRWGWGGLGSRRAAILCRDADAWCARRWHAQRKSFEWWRCQHSEDGQSGQRHGTASSKRLVDNALIGRRRAAIAR